MKIELQAYGKVNLGLDVLRRRPDGYHEVKMIMQTVKLHDTLTFETVDEDVIVLSTNADELPVNEDNLVYKACRMLKQEYQITRGIRVFLQKELPVAAGMAGGSADAAAALIGMNKIFDLQIPKHKLMEYGVKLGADVPYCIMKGTALSEGIGEKLTALAPMPDVILFRHIYCIYRPNRRLYLCACRTEALKIMLTNQIRRRLIHPLYIHRIIAKCRI